MTLNNYNVANSIFCANSYIESLQPIMPKKIIDNDMKRIIFIDSLKRIIPKITVPITPIPVHTVYETLKGIVFKDKFKNTMLKHIALITAMDGISFEKFSVYFKPTAHAISQIPAKIKYIQSFIKNLFWYKNGTILFTVQLFCNQANYEFVEF